MASSTSLAPTRLRLPLAALLWLFVMGGAGTFASCYGHNCDGSSATYGIAPGEGELLTPDSWESSPSTGNAIPYTRERTIFFQIPAFTGRRFVDIQAFVSAEENPTAANTNTTLGSATSQRSRGAPARSSCTTTRAPTTSFASTRSPHPCRRPPI